MVSEHRKHLDLNKLEDLWKWRTQLVSCFNKPVSWSKVERSTCVTSHQRRHLWPTVHLDQLYFTALDRLSLLSNPFWPQIQWRKTPSEKCGLYLAVFHIEWLPNSYPLRVYASPWMSIYCLNSCILGQEPENINMDCGDFIIMKMKEQNCLVAAKR